MIVPRMTDARSPAPTEQPVVLTVAGSDSGGGAGIQADLKTMEAHDAFGTSVVTAVTAQNTTGVASTHVLPVAEIEAQLDAVLSDFDVGALKTGMLATAETVETVTDSAREFDGPVVVDPVMVAATGDRLLSPEAEDAYEDLIAEATVVTPNADEAAVLTGVEATDEADQRRAGKRLLEIGAEAALVKGGHVPGDAVRDILVTSEDVVAFEHPRVDPAATHGSGCMLASAIAARLGHGESVDDAVERSVDLMERAVRYHHDVGEGPGAVNHLVDLRNDAAREPTAEQVASVVGWFVDRDVSPLVPEVGMNVVGATPHAESPSDCAAVEGRITRTLSGVKPNRGVRFGASSHVARFLLAAREVEPDLRFAVNCRFDDDVGAALATLDGPVAEYDRDAEPEAVERAEGSTMQWGARQAFGDRDGVGSDGAADEGATGRPVAVVDRGAVGKEAITKLVAEDAGDLAERVVDLLEAVEGER
jgi:hydroxymethylpyrimidine/phosphomethylpyrimidine kinase